MKITFGFRHELRNSNNFSTDTLFDGKSSPGSKVAGGMNTITNTAEECYDLCKHLADSDKDAGKTNKKCVVFEWNKADGNSDEKTCWMKFQRNEQTDAGVISGIIFHISWIKIVYCMFFPHI